MPVPETTRSNIWKLTLEIEDSADLAAFIADPDGTEWPLEDDYDQMYQALRRYFGRLPLIQLPAGGQGRIVKVSLEDPDDGEFLTPRNFRNQVKGEREAPVLRTELPQDAAAALGMLLSAERYLSLAPRSDLHNFSLWQDAARSTLRDAGLDIEMAEDFGNVLGEDLQDQADFKWQRRKELGMLAPGWRPA